ncbi:hypothetical protein LINGRAHAP2_LOCUS9898 [Linum grandiflorum]
MEPGGAGETDQRADEGGAGVREREGGSEPGDPGEDGESAGREAQGEGFQVEEFQSWR